MSRLWVETVDNGGYVRADAITRVAVAFHKGKWRVVVTFLGGGSEGGWDDGGAGDVSPVVAAITDGCGNPDELKDVPNDVVRALVRHRDDSGVVAVDHHISDGGVLYVRDATFHDWSDETGSP